MLEGLTNDTYWDWKDTLGPLKNRPGFQGVWGYQQTHGLGMMEYLEWAEDMDLQIGKLALLHYDLASSDILCQSSPYGLVSL